MDEHIELEREELEQLKSIDATLDDLKDLAPSPKRAFLNGLLQGMGIVAGSLAAVALIGWLLSLLGLIPGLETIVNYIRGLMSQG